MHQSLHLRQQIAQEAARLLSSGYVCDFSRAIKRAARLLHRGRLSKHELPTHAEIQAFLLQQRVETGVLQHTPQHLLEELIRCLENLIRIFPDIGLLVEYSAEQQVILPGYKLCMFVELSSQDIEEILVDAGAELEADLFVDQQQPEGSTHFRLQTQHLVIEVCSLMEQFHIDGILLTEFLQQQLAGQQASFLVSETQQQESLLDWSFAFELLPLLVGVRVDSYEHPEGDLCYHSQQVYQLGHELEPYDVEFLEACLFHDLGYVKNHHAPQAASVDLLTGIASERTLFFISELPAAHEYLQSGQLRGALRKSPDLDLLIELAKLDRQGREMGVAVPDLEEIETYLASLS